MDEDYGYYNLKYAIELMETSLDWLIQRAKENPEPRLLKLIEQIQDFIR